MKLVIKKGESVDDALQYLQDFLAEYSAEYPKLKSNMNIYITLEGYDRRICPENDKEFILTKEKLIDVEGEELEKKKLLALRSWQVFLLSQKDDVKRAEKNVTLDLRYINSAEERGRKPEAIEKRKELLAKNQKILKDEKDYNLFLKELNSLVEKNEIKWFFRKFISRKSAYDYTITPYIVFENDSIGCWYYEMYEDRRNSWCYSPGKLKKGHPANTN